MGIEGGRKVVHLVEAVPRGETLNRDETKRQSVRSGSRLGSSAQTLATEEIHEALSFKPSERQSS